LATKALVLPPWWAGRRNLVPFSGIDSYLAHDVRILLSHDFLEIADLIWRLRRQSIEWS